jgi:hypothetical protein
MLAGHYLPTYLKQLLENPRILKVGRNVRSDLAYLQKACESTRPFCGGIELGRMARERLLIKSGRLSLGDMVAIILKCRINKDVSM